MNRKLLIAIAITLAVLVILGLSLVLFLWRGGKVSVRPTTTPSAAASPTASPAPVLGKNEAAEQQIVAYNNQPIIRALPKYTAYWALTYGGSDSGKYRVNAKVFVRPGQTADAAVATQKPYILAFIKQTGQPENTVIVNYTTAPVESD